jgi:hypothetical protein
MSTGEFVARKGIPADVREAYARLYKVFWEERLTLPANTPPHEAKRRHGEWLAEIETRIATLRAVAKGEGQPLTRINAIALAGFFDLCRNSTLPAYQRGRRSRRAIFTTSIKRHNCMARLIGLTPHLP